jgi:hypothetical protein
MVEMIFCASEEFIAAGENFFNSNLPYNNDHGKNKER